MKANKFWSLLMMLVMALAMVSCGSDDDEKKDDNGGDDGGTTVTTEYTATTEVKQAKLNNIDHTEVASLKNPKCVIYADFNYKYALTLYRGSLRIEPLYRSSGEWWNDTYDSRSYRDESYQSLGAIKDLGKLAGVEAITEKNLGGKIIASAAQPQHGYAMKFKTEDDEWKYLRVYIKGYTLDDKEALSSITVQYQLY